MSKGKKPDVRDDGPDRFSHLDELHLGGIERDLEVGKYVEPEALSEALRKHGSRPIPSVVLDYLCLLLEGAVPRPKGRKALSEIDRRRMEMILKGFYDRNLAWLQARKEKYGHLDGWLSIRKSDFWKGTPGERAARMVAARYFYGVESWRTVQNIARSRK